MKKQGDYSIGSDVWPGTSKLIEETGELQQVLGKLLGSTIGMGRTFESASSRSLQIFKLLSSFFDNVT